MRLDKRLLPFVSTVFERMGINESSRRGESQFICAFPCNAASQNSEVAPDSLVFGS